MKFLNAEMDARTITDKTGKVLDRWPALTWKKSFAEIAADRVKHFAKKAEIMEGTESYQRLLKVSRNDAEVLDWARRSFAPERLRASWFMARVEVTDDGLPEEPTGDTTTLEQMKAENEALKERLARLEKAGAKK